MTRYKVLPNILLNYQGKNLVHAVNPLEDNFTLCSVAISDENTEIIEENSKQKINCPICIMFINYCKSFKENDLKG